MTMATARSDRVMRMIEEEWWTRGAGGWRGRARAMVGQVEGARVRREKKGTTAK